MDRIFAEQCSCLLLGVTDPLLIVSPPSFVTSWSRSYQSVLYPKSLNGGSDIFCILPAFKTQGLDPIDSPFIQSLDSTHNDGEDIVKGMMNVVAVGHSQLLDKMKM